ncbi:MAG: DUF488 family protein [Chloroflexi bacterium]|nr:DUF488 family protein [Chloroflexota bacterium]
MFNSKRVYDSPETDDGTRVLVDRLWPRGLTREQARIDRWMNDIAPSDSLRRWFAHKEERWEEFKRRYAEELRGKAALAQELKDLGAVGTVTLLYAARDREKNNAQALLEFLETG